MFYGHYDVVDAQYDPAEWHAEPFQLHPLNGYLYGRGVTDNKAPILAALYAVADLARHGTLTCNVVFLIEGEEEAGHEDLLMQYVAIATVLATSILYFFQIATGSTTTFRA